MSDILSKALKRAQALGEAFYILCLMAMLQFMELANSLARFVAKLLP